MRKKFSIMVCAYFLFVSIGMIVDTVNKIDNYGWVYNVTSTIDNNTTTTTFYSTHSIVFTVLFLINSLIAIYLLFLDEK